ncbi:MAG TPA: hypothetical protein VGI58_04720 [Streptosporangiaceae bacterium]
MPVPRVEVPRVEVLRVEVPRVLVERPLDERVLAVRVLVDRARDLVDGRLVLLLALLGTNSPSPVADGPRPFATPPVEGQCPCLARSNDGGTRGS